jgi:predicted alpha/beta superfamily hydrolase
LQTNSDRPAAREEAQAIASALRVRPAGVYEFSVLPQSELEPGGNPDATESASEAHEGLATPTPIPRLHRFRLQSAILPEPAERCLLVYLPAAYETEPERRFPVFYLHDGQNLFDEKMAYVPGHPWWAHTTADRLAEAGEMEPTILVGIGNTGFRRMAEYTPTRDYKLGGGEGRTYGRLLREELKLFIDKTYRTKTGPESTGLGGSSLGGLISLFLGFEHPEVFGKLAVMSPSIWWDHRSILGLVESVDPRPDLRIWLDMGTAEGSRHLRDADQLFKILKRRGWREHVDLAYQRVSGGVHSEDAWAARFDDVLRFLFPAA